MYVMLVIFLVINNWLGNNLYLLKKGLIRIVVGLMVNLIDLAFRVLGEMIVMEGKIKMKKLESNWLNKN